VHLIGADLADLRDVGEGAVFAPEATILVLNGAYVNHVYIETAGIRDGLKDFLFATNRAAAATEFPKSP
jgi:hypothetical protein